MTVREYLYLSWLSYIDFPPLYISLLDKGGSIPVAAFADCVLRMDAANMLKCVRMNDASRAAARYMKNSACFITDYINNNSTDGFVAYVIRCPSEIVVAMRGSEGGGACAAGYVDWADNICEPFSGSVQLPSIRRLLSTLPDGVPVTFTGHSKGGHNALLALAESRGDDFRAVAFNGQGFSGEALTSGMEERLRKHAVNYVVAGDIVGALLYHPERRVYVRQTPDTNAHMPEAFVFNEDGVPVTTRRTPVSLFTEAATRLAEGSLGRGLRKSASDVCRIALKY